MDMATAIVYAADRDDARQGHGSNRRPLVWFIVIFLLLVIVVLLIRLDRTPRGQ